MDYRKKNILYTLILLVSVFTVFLYRKNQTVGIFIEGNTMGTTYHVTYFDAKKRNFKPAIDSLLDLVNKSINTYDSTSEVSRFNRSKDGIAVRLPYLLPPLRAAAEVFKNSQGAFDPTVMPLVNAWGFGPGKVFQMDSARVDSLKQFVGFEKVQLTQDSVMKLDARTQLDFGGIGQGYGADVITEFLKSKGITDMLVELGGEGMACGLNLDTGKSWKIGILDPNSTREKQFFKAYASLSNKSFTTSGNYFNYKEIDGRKYSHTIDPETGYPVQREILSASVFAADCTTADAWATAFMVMGHDRAVEILKQRKDLDAFLVFSTPDGKIDTYMTEGISSFIEMN
jgi:thiamine biosynthesis lipoprotein